MTRFLNSSVLVGNYALALSVSRERARGQRAASVTAVSNMSAPARVCVLGLGLLGGLLQVLAQGEGKAAQVFSRSILLSADLTAAGR